jgi:hypothetical protein
MFHAGKKKTADAYACFFFSVFRVCIRMHACAFMRVQGPPVELKLGGAEFTDMCSFLPPPPGVGLGVVVFSQNDSVYVSCNCDSNLFSDAEVHLSSDARVRVLVVCAVHVAMLLYSSVFSLKRSILPPSFWLVRRW